MRRLPVLVSEERTSRAAIRFRAPETPRSFGRPTLPSLRDGFGRAYSYLRLSVTDRCDLACRYCMPEGGEEEHGLRRDLLSFEEAARVVSVFASMGIDRVRFTGGEPLVRKDIVDLVGLVRERSGVDDLVMTTNATRLGDLAPALRGAGLVGVNVSIDSFRPERFREVTRGGDLAKVLRGIERALEVGLRVKLNTVLLRGINDDELGEIVERAFSFGATPRFIELMPIGVGRDLLDDHHLPASEAMAALADHVDTSHEARFDPKAGPARYLEARAGGGKRVGFITAVSDTFCESCNRIRITAQGDIRACLASRRAVSLRDLAREGASDRDLAWAIHCALSTKDGSHYFTTGQTEEHGHVGMSLIGG